jgi:hypothetical protein
MKLYGLSLLILSCATSALASVYVSAPGNNSNVATTVQYVATASTSCSKGVAAMGIYTAPYQLAYKVGGAKLNTLLTLNANTTYYTMVQEWDNCGGSASTPVTIHVGGGSGGGSGKTFYNLDKGGGWNGFGMLPTAYNICSNCSPKVTWSRWTGIKSPSLSGSSTQHNVGGTTQYADAFWNNHLIGDFSTQGLPDSSKSLVPSLHNFIYDVYFFGTNISASQALEFDINQFFGGKSYIWGHECRIAGGHQWDVWDNQAKHWHATGIPCNPLNNAWNHLTIQVQRGNDGSIRFQSITLNGVKSYPNFTSWPIGTSWYGVTINYQQDGNYKQSAYSIWLDKLNFSYW